MADESITRKQFSELEDEYGKKAARKALAEFANNELSADTITSGSRGVKIAFKDQEDSFDSGKAPTLEEVRQTAAVIQGRLAGLNEVSNKKAKVLGLASLRPRPEQLVNDARQSLATQRLRAGQFGVNDSVSGATTGLLSPSHLARQRLIRNPLFASGGR